MLKTEKILQFWNKKFSFQRKRLTLLVKRGGRSLVAVAKETIVVRKCQSELDELVSRLCILISIDTLAGASCSEKGYGVDPMASCQRLYPTWPEKFRSGTGKRPAVKLRRRALLARLAYQTTIVVPTLLASSSLSVVLVIIGLFNIVVINDNVEDSYRVTRSEYLSRIDHRV